ncbi:MAG: phosphomannomutase, partial [Hyphomicrobiales bacterium]
PLPGWIAEYGLDGIVSADGDGDRPLLLDGEGTFVRGDVLGLLAAQYLKADTVVTPVTSNSGIERTGAFARVLRTRVGSPFVVAEMDKGDGSVVGFEANGGTFVGRNVKANGRALTELATRDAVLPILTALGSASAAGGTINDLVAGLPLRHALADRLQNVASEKSARFLERLEREDGYAQTVFAGHGIARVSNIDGLRFELLSGDVVHFRASGNAPELRSYVEGSTPKVARDLLDWALSVSAEATR